jgi:CBS domain containing-hemolysin-like protein
MLHVLLYFVGFVLLSGTMSLIDAAMLSVSRAEIEELVVRNVWGAKALKRLSRHMTRAVIVIVIFSNLVNVLGPILVGEQAIREYGSGVIGAITALLTLATILFSEIVPKSLGRHYAPGISCAVAPVLLALVFILLPAVLPLEWLVGKLKSGRRVVGTEEQIRALTRIGRMAGHIHAYEGHIVQRAFVLNDKTATDVMTPIDQVAFVTSKATIRDAAETVFRYTYSRYPVIGTDIHNILGVVLSRSILTALAEGKDDVPVTEIMTHLQSVDAAMRADELLLFLRRKRTHMAVVKKEFETVGLVTLEDVLEELVGEIEDEEDIRRYNTKAAMNDLLQKGSVARGRKEKKST